MTSLKTQKKAFSFSIDSIINSDKDKVSEEYKKEKQPLAHAIVSGHLSPVSFVENAPLSMLPEESDFRGDEELSECSDTSGQMSTTHNSTCSTPESDQSGLSNKSPSSDSSLGSLSTPVMTRKKKARTAFTQKQIDDLEKRYSSQRYLTATERGDLAEELELTDQQVKTWFQNRRMKEKRQRHDKLDGPAFPTGGVDVSQLHALGIPCPLPPGGAPQYTSAMNAHHSRPLPNLLPHSMPMFPQHIPGYPPMPRQTYGGLPVYHSYGLPFPHQMSLPVQAFGPVQ